MDKTLKAIRYHFCLLAQSNDNNMQNLRAGLGLTQWASLKYLYYKNFSTRSNFDYDIEFFNQAIFAKG